MILFIEMDKLAAKKPTYEIALLVKLHFWFGEVTTHEIYTGKHLETEGRNNLVP